MDKENENLTENTDTVEHHEHHEHHGHHGHYEHHKHHEHHEHHHGHHSHSHSHTSDKKTSSGKKTPVKNFFGKLSAEFSKQSGATKKNGLLKSLKARAKKLSRSDILKICSVAAVLLCVITVAVVSLVNDSNHVHSFGEWKVVESATCKKDGREARYCECGEKQSRTVSKSHELEFVVINDTDGMAEYSCTLCGETVKKIPTYNDIGIPVISITAGNVAVYEYSDADVVYSSESNSFETEAQIKYQGASTLIYDKKNFNIKFKDSRGKKYKVEMHDGWGKHSKYCLKANFAEASFLRNVCSAKLYGQIAHDGTRNDYFTTLVNGGAIDGFPVVLYLNDRFNGVYTLNIPKDEWLFNIKDGEGKQAILFATSWGQSPNLQKKVDYSLKDSGFDLTYCSTEDDYFWAVDSFNEFIDFLNISDNDTFIEKISGYTDVDAAIDTMLFLYAIGAVDNVSKNILWVSLDGVKWTPIPYDLDLTWGLTNYGKDFTNEKYMSRNLNDNRLFARLTECFPEKVKNRYYQICSNVLNTDNIRNVFQSFRDEIPDDVIKLEHRKWIEKPNIVENTIDQIVMYSESRLKYVGEFFK